MTESKYRRFTEEELNHIHNHPELSNKQLGEQLGRPAISIYGARFRHDIPFKKMTERITSEEIAFIRDHPSLTAKAIAVALGRKYRRVTLIRRKYRLLKLVRFTQEEIDFIRKRSTWSASELGAALGRTRGAIIQMRHRHRLPLVASRRVPSSMRCSREEIDFIRSHPEMTAKEIGKLLSRTAGGITAIRFRMRIPTSTMKVK